MTYGKITINTRTEKTQYILLTEQRRKKTLIFERSQLSVNQCQPNYSYYNYYYYKTKHEGMRLRANVEENNPSLACCPVQNITNKDSSSHSFSSRIPQPTS